MNHCYEVNIDFDEASAAWNKNKKRVGHSYVYVCEATTKKGMCCSNKRYKALDYCYIHRNHKK
jgi:hypothetical protein